MLRYMNVFTTSSTNFACKNLDILNKSGVIIEQNFEQVIAMANNKEIDRLCIYMDVWNVFEKFNCMRGQSAAEKIHSIDSTIPILIWDGRTYDPEDKDFLDVPSSFVVSGKVHPIINSNELYLSFDYSWDIIDITKKFFEGILTEKDVPVKDYLTFEFKQ